MRRLRPVQMCAPFSPRCALDVSVAVDNVCVYSGEKTWRRLRTRTACLFPPSETVKKKRKKEGRYGVSRVDDSHSRHGIGTERVMRITVVKIYSIESAPGLQSLMFTQPRADLRPA